MKALRGLVAESLLAFNRLIGSSRTAAEVGSASALVFAPHPDDEVLGCGGVIALKARAGAPVRVVVMTDGRASHGALIEPDELARMRRAEAAEAAHRLGLAEPYLFLEFHDQRLADSHDAACAQVAGLIDRFRPVEIYLPSRRDGIADHVETNRIVRRAAARAGSTALLLEYPLWLWNGWPWTGDGARGLLRMTGDAAEIVFACRTRVEVGSVLQQKRAALACYRSQLERLDGDPRWAVLSDVADGEFLRRFETGVEIFRRAHASP